MDPEQTFFHRHAFCPLPGLKVGRPLPFFCLMAFDTGDPA